MDDPLFYTELKNDSLRNNNPHISAGDFNLIMGPEIDCMAYVNVNNPNETELQC